MKLIDSGDLSFRALAQANEKRVIVFRDGRGELAHPIDQGGIENWSIPEWTNAMSGEAGEAGNIAKKIRRGDFGTSGPEYEAAIRRLGHELADTVIYADLCAQRIGVSLGDMVREKFNFVSDQTSGGEDIKL